MLRDLFADLHVHTVLSPCAETEMFPEIIVQQAQELGLELIAITDHNSAENVAAVIRASAGTGITVLPGMEVQTREEIHLICVFDKLRQVLEWQEQVYTHLPPLKNREEVFGIQVVLDATGEIAGYNERLLLTSTSFSVEEVVERVAGLNGLCIPAHVDRPAYSIVSNLGFVPPGLAVPALEISRMVGLWEARERFAQLRQYSLIANGDAHRREEMARRTRFRLTEPSVAEIALALAGEGGRGVWIDGDDALPGRTGQGGLSPQSCAL